MHMETVFWTIVLYVLPLSLFMGHTIPINNNNKKGESIVKVYVFLLLLKIFFGLQIDRLFCQLIDSSKICNLMFFGFQYFSLSYGKTKVRNSGSKRFYLSFMFFENQIFA